MAIAMPGGGEETPMSEINTTPLVDVMLVLLIIFLIAVPVAIQSIEQLKVPIIESEESQDKVENLMLSITSTDGNGLSPGEAGYSGASREGACRVYINDTPVNSDELQDRSFKRLDAIVKREGGPEAIAENPDLIPQVHIRADQNAPWKCVAGAIYQIQAAGYPTVGFISTPIDPDA